ncbi:hypothetical protein [Vibrio phage MZH0603]|nr:hypothetical protein [Vibrio phage MZH0603]
MPSYKVKQMGFFDGRLYDPNGKRPVLHTDKELKPVPKWLEPIKSETPAQAKKRKAAESKAAKAAAEKAEADKQDIAEASFMGDGESSNVETL